jgi:DNA repair photolyase
MGLIYKPRGRALEYSEWALNMGTGCVHGCKYCYAPACLFKQRDVFNSGFQVKENLLQKLERESLAFEDKKNRILLSFTHDPYQSVEVGALTRQVIQILKRHGCCFQVLTKGGQLATKDFDLYDERDAFATSLTLATREDSLYYEPGAAVPSERIKALKLAKSLEIETWVSFEPVLDDKAVFVLYEQTKEFVDLFKVGKISGFKSRVKDWHRFVSDMIDRMDSDGKNYYIKKDLAKYL